MIPSPRFLRTVVRDLNVRREDQGHKKLTRKPSTFRTSRRNRNIHYAVPIRSALFSRFIGSPGGTRTPDKAVNSRLLYQLSYRGMGSGEHNSVSGLQSQGLSRRKHGGVPLYLAYNSTAFRPANARESVTSSAYSSSPPFGIPWAGRVARTPYS